MKFYALVAVDHQYRLVGLTSGLSCIEATSDGRDRKALYRAFAAASVVQARILQEAQVPDCAATRDPTYCPPLPVNHQNTQMAKVSRQRLSLVPDSLVPSRPTTLPPSIHHGDGRSREKNHPHQVCAWVFDCAAPFMCRTGPCAPHPRFRNSSRRVASHRHGVYCIRCANYPLTWSQFSCSTVVFGAGNTRW